VAAIEKDIEAAGRLAREVAIAYADPHRDVPRNDNQLHQKTGIARSTLDGYFKYGVFPEPGNLRAIADALRLDYTTLWCRWLNVPLPDDALVRIAEALERAYPKPDRADVQVAIDAAREDPRAAPEDGPPSGPVAFSPRHTPGGGTRPR